MRGRMEKPKSGDLPSLRNSEGSCLGIVLAQGRELGVVDEFDPLRGRRKGVKARTDEGRAGHTTAMAAWSRWRASCLGGSGFMRMPTMSGV